MHSMMISRGTVYAVQQDGDSWVLLRNGKHSGIAFKSQEQADAMAALLNREEHGVQKKIPARKTI